ncbi:ABC transporter ATP-binding protein [Malacoplasma iowae]|uniref:ABC transporter ATP-binding protein n=1 Tax=Malacoplasma iowae TaxID=2116 RepID=UPI002A18ADF3|nr:ABC transporter ATP-binding protein [Malacoplasma iowae]WPL40331.1 ABC transporter ATP-binding protein [Malacoplasma iowae]
MSFIKIENINLEYDKKNKIIENLSIDIDKGEFISIIGPNGCGKSTLLKSIARLLKPKKGHIFYDKKDIYEYKPKEYSKLVSFVPQLTTYPTDVTVYEFVKMGRFPYSNFITTNEKEDKQKVEEALKYTDLTDLKDKYVDELSGGQKQRALLALALAQDTETVLLDEPTNHLDIKNQLEMIHLLHELNHTLKKTIILVIHDINHAMKFSDKIIIMNKGQIIGTGPTNDIVDEEIILKVFGVNASIIKSQDKKIISDYWIDSLQKLASYHKENKEETSSDQNKTKQNEKPNLVDKIKSNKKEIIK